jgi:hypothetical protein
MRTIAEIIKRQFGPQLEMVRAALLMGPDSVFDEDEIGLREHLYHVLVGMDVWFTEDVFSYPFDQIVESNASELKAPAGGTLSREFLLDYLDRMIEKTNALPDDDAAYLEPAILRGQEFTLLDRCIMQFRHIQHHVGVFNERMRAHGLSTVPWKGFGEG